MALDSAPERRVRTPGARASVESSDVANVSVTKGRWASLPWWGDAVAPGRVSVVADDDNDDRGGGRCGSRAAAEEAGKVSCSDITVVTL